MKKRADLGKLFPILIGIVSAIVLFSSFVLSDPTGPTTLTRANSGRFLNYSDGLIVQAMAGNVTGLTMTQSRVTQAWQGYYGNISGTITLDDAGNFTLYDWSLPAPTGEVYAANFSIVTWTNIYCMNVTGSRNVSGNGSGGSPPSVGTSGVIYNINGSQIELNFGINATDLDGLNETFNDTYTDATGFRTGSVRIDVTDGCSMAHPYTDEGYSNAWQELLLTDNQSLVFTTLIRQDAAAFQNGAGDFADFEMLVLQNGHVGSGFVTNNYFFFVELS